MEIVLVDTSVWINFFKAKETDASLFLKNNLSNFIIATCPVIVQEVLQGVKSERDFETINSYFNDLIRFTGNAYELAADAARLYRHLRRNGVTVRKPNDCLIALFAIKNNVRLLNDDRDFKLISNHSSLKVYDFE